MARCRKIRLRNIEAQRFTTGGGTVYYNVEIDPCSGVVKVWEKRRRTVATMDLSGLAALVMQRHYEQMAREQQTERRRRRSVRRGALAFRSLGGTA
jgi:hypothetical protein